jgi:hypothetical protein
VSSTTRCCGRMAPRRDGVRVLTRTMKKITGIAGAAGAQLMLTLPVGVGGGATGPHVVRMRRSIRIANPLVLAAERSRGPAFAITEFATDSPLEGHGFELPVPREKWAARISLPLMRRVRLGRSNGAFLGSASRVSQ